MVVDKPIAKALAGDLIPNQLAALHLTNRREEGPNLLLAKKVNEQQEDQSGFIREAISEDNSLPGSNGPVSWFVEGSSLSGWSSCRPPPACRSESSAAGSGRPRPWPPPPPSPRPASGGPESTTKINQKCVRKKGFSQLCFFIGS